MFDLIAIHLFNFIAGLVFGGILGSFVTMLAYRLPRGKKLDTPRSSCPHCNKIIAWRDLIPIYSYIELKGRCRNCHKPFGIRYLKTELCSALVVGFTLLFYGFTSKTLALVVIFEILLTLGLILSDKGGIKSAPAKKKPAAKEGEDGDESGEDAGDDGAEEEKG